METKKTVGQLSTELALKEDRPVSAIEQMYENLTDYERELLACVETHKKIFPDNFYIVVITKKERLMPNVIRHYFLARLSCPTPDYDQTVYRYAGKNDQIKFMWVIPSRDTCFFLLENKHEVAPAEYTLLNYVLQFQEGSLFKLAQSLNNEVN